MLGADIRLLSVAIAVCAPLAFVAPASAQSNAAGAAPIPASEVSLRREIFHNDRLNVFLLEIPPKQATAMHRHDKDMLTVFVSGGQSTSTIQGSAPVADTYAVGEVRFKRAGFTHATRNEGAQTFRAVIVELSDPQGEAISEQRPVRRQCNDGSHSTCVEEKHLFCTTTFCAEDVRMAPGATRSGFASDADQMLIAVSDYQLSNDFDGSTASSRERTSGQVEWIPAGVANRWTNAGDAPARFVVIRFSADR